MKKTKLNMRVLVLGVAITGYLALSLAHSSTVSFSELVEQQPPQTAAPTPAAEEEEEESALVDYEADLMANRGDNITRLVGNVRFHHNGAIIQCDSAFKYEEEKMEFFGNVVIEKDSALVYGDKVYYNGNTNKADVYAPIVKMMRGDVTLYSYNLQFDTKTSVGVFHGGGVMNQKDNNMESDRGAFDANANYVKFLGKVAVENKSYLIKTDSLGFSIDDERLDFLTRTFIWSEDENFLQADSGHYYSATKSYLFTSNAFVMTSDNELWADTMRYYTEQKQSYMFSNVQILDTTNSTIAFSDWAFYDDSIERAVLGALPSVRVWDDKDTSYMRADTIMLVTLLPDGKALDSTKVDDFKAGDVSGSEDNASKVRGVDTTVVKPVVDSLTLDSLKIDSLKVDSLVVDSLITDSLPVVDTMKIDTMVMDTMVMDTMVMDSMAVDTMLMDSMVVDSVIVDSVVIDTIAKEPDKERHIKAYRNVRTWSEDYQSKCDSVVAYSIDSTTTLFGSPVLWSQNNQITATQINVYTKNEEIDWAEFVGDPVISQQVRRGDTLLFNQAIGKVMETYFSDNDIDYAYLSGNVQNIYYMTEGEDVTAMVSIDCADLTMLFTDREPTKMIWKGKGKGPIHPIDKVPETQPRFLTGFTWQDSIRPKSAWSISPRVARPSLREEKSKLVKPVFSITDRMNLRKEELLNSGKWTDRVDMPDVTPEYFIEQRNEHLLY